MEKTWEQKKIQELDGLLNKSETANRELNGQLASRDDIILKLEQQMARMKDSNWASNKEELDKVGAQYTGVKNKLQNSEFQNSQLQARIKHLQDNLKMAQQLAQARNGGGEDNSNLKLQVKGLEAKVRGRQDEINALQKENRKLGTASNALREQNKQANAKATTLMKEVHELKQESLQKDAYILERLKEVHELKQERMQKDAWDNAKIADLMMQVHGLKQEIKEKEAELKEMTIQLQSLESYCMYLYDYYIPELEKSVYTPAAI
jgi:chromosome segregation ATPase